VSFWPGLILCVLCAHAQQAVTDKPARPDPAKVAQIEELFSVQRLEQLHQQTLSQIEAIMNDQISKTALELAPSPEEREKARADVQAFEKQLFALIADRMKFENLKPELIKIYDESFSSEQLAGITAFYKSPAGQAYVQKLPELSSKSAALGTRLMQDAMPEFQRMTQEWSNRMRQKYGEPPAK
jgi:uncharacterized protein